jgi:hypothetical protein
MMSKQKVTHKFLNLEPDDYVPSFIITPQRADFVIPAEFAHKFMKLNSEYAIPSFVIYEEEAREISSKIKM